MAPFLSTDAIAAKLKLKGGRATITQWIKKRQLAPPEKGPGGTYLWTAADLPRLRAIKQANAKRMRTGRPRKKRK